MKALITCSMDRWGRKVHARFFFFLCCFVINWGPQGNVFCTLSSFFLETTGLNQICYDYIQIWSNINYASSNL